MARLAGPYGRGTGFPAGLLFPYQLQKSDGCNLLKTKLEFASSSKAHGPLGRAIRKRNWLPGRIAFPYQSRKSDGCNLLKTKLEFASSSKADCTLGRGHTEEELASRPACFCIPIAQKRRLQLAENKAR